MDTVLHNRIKELIQQEDFSSAENLLLEQLYSNPLEFQAILLIGIVYTETSRNREGCKSLAFYLQHFPEDPDALEALGCAYYRREEYKKAEGYFKESLKVRPAQASVMRNLGVLYCNTKNGEEGLALLEKAVESDPSDFRTAIALSSAYAYNGDYSRAKAVLGSCLSYPVPASYRIWMEDELKKYEKNLS
jgi:Tfp pilus assembly protein PilF